MNVIILVHLNVSYILSVKITYGYACVVKVIWAARWCSGSGVGHVIERSRVRFSAVALPGSLS